MKKLLFSDPPNRSIQKILLIMKLTIILTLVFTLNLSATGFGQISLNEKGKSVKEILGILEKETSYRFFYNDDLKAIDNVVDIEVESGNINQILDKLFKSTDFDYKLFENNLIVITLKSDDFQMSVSGTVTDASTGEGLPGVSILVKGTTTGMSTDINGSYTITIPNANATLVFSFIGYIPQEVLVSGRAKVDVSLKVDVTTLEEVVVVGYGTQKKSDITGTVASLSRDRLENAPNLNVAQAIQGAVPGVMVQQTAGGAQASSSIMIRGRNSITANNDPLIIVDGIPYGGQMNDINPNDVQSIEVLKDASAAAIYGSRGANGVILISTKSGVEGKTVFSYDGKYSIQKVIKIHDMLTGPEFYDFKMERSPSQMTLSEKQVGEDGTWTDYYKLMVRTGQSQEHNLSVSGGYKNTKYYIGGGLTDIKGIAKNDNFRRFSTRVNVETKLFDWLAIGTRSQLNFDNASGSEPDFSDAFITNPLSHAYDEYGNLTVFPWPDNIIVGNPLQDLLYDDLDKSYQVLTNNYLQLDVPWIKGLSYRLNTGVRMRFTDRANYRGRDTQSGLADLGRASVSNSLNNSTVIENILTYNKTFGEHTLFLTGLYSYEGSTSRSNGTTGTRFPNDFLSWYGLAQATTVVPSNSYSKTDLVSQMARVNYSYASRYLLTATIRRDGYSGFGADNKWGIFPSVALGWNLAKESFFPAKDVINDLKLRVSLGLNGNQAIGAYQSLSRFVVANYTSGTNAVIGYKPGTMGISNLGWESSRTMNVGMDFGLFKDRITGNLDYYLTDTYDLLLDRSISVNHGITTNTHLPSWEHPAVMENIGKTQNKGLEMVLNTRNIVKNKFQWSTSVNFSLNINKIVSLYGLKDESGKEVDDLSNNWFIGQPIKVNYDYKWEGVWQLNDADTATYKTHPGYARLQDRDQNDTLDSRDRQIIGQQDPKFLWGMTNTFTYGNFGLSIFIHGVHGATMRNYTMADDVSGVEVRYNTTQKNWWTPTNPTNEWIVNKDLANKMGSGTLIDYEKTDFIRVKDISLSYDLPKGLTSKLGLSRVRCYITGRNLMTFTKWRGLDPELSSSGSQREIPMQKEYVFGLSLGF